MKNKTKVVVGALSLATVVGGISAAGNKAPAPVRPVVHTTPMANHSAHAAHEAHLEHEVVASPTAVTPSYVPPSYTEPVDHHSNVRVCVGHHIRVCS